MMTGGSLGVVLMAGHGRPTLARNDRGKGRAAMYWFSFFLGIWVGCNFGAVLMGMICAAAKHADDLDRIARHGK
jgi:hypothetical protein